MLLTRCYQSFGTCGRFHPRQPSSVVWRSVVQDVFGVLKDEGVTCCNVFVGWAMEDGVRDECHDPTMPRSPTGVRCHNHTDMAIHRSSLSHSPPSPP